MVEPHSQRSAGDADPQHHFLVPPTITLSTVEKVDRPSLHVRLFGSHMFFRLWLAQVVSALGDWLGFLAITVLAARVGGTAAGTSVGLVMIARILPGFFLAPLAGALVDRWDRKKVMVLCDLGRGAVVAALPFVDTVLGLVVASFLLEIGTLLWSPAKEASVPNLVPPDRLTSANSLSLVAAYGTFPAASLLFALLAGVAKFLGGFDALETLRVGQEALAFYVDVATFGLSAIMISTLALPEARRRQRRAERRGRAETGGAALTQTLRDVKEGWQYMFITPEVRAVNLGLALGLIGGGMVVPLGAVFSSQVLGAGAAGFGVFTTALGFGAAVGVIALSATHKWLPKEKVFVISLLGAGVSLGFAASMSTLTPAALFVAVLGIGAGSVYVLGFTLLHENVEDDLRGRVFSGLYTLVRMCLLIAFAIGPFLSQLLDELTRDLFSGAQIELAGLTVWLPGVRVTLWLAGLLIFIGGGIAGLSMRARQPATKGGDAPR